MRLLSSAALLLALTAPVAWAQEERAETDAAPLRLGDVEVRARRVSETVAEVPLAVSVMTRDTLADISATGEDITYLSARTPALIAESSFGRTFPRFYIRGLGNPDFDLNTSQPISLVYDQVPYESPILKGFPIFDVAQVEVLRGPQGTLFGRNTTAGTIRIDSVRPDTTANSGYFRGSYGSYETANVEAALNYAISDTAALRLSGIIQSRADWVDNAEPGEQATFGGYTETAFRAQFLATPLPELDILLNVHTRRLEGEQILFRANIFDQGSNGLNDNYDRDTVFQDAPSEQMLDQAGITLSVDWEIGDFTLSYVAGYETAQIGTRGDGDGGAGANFLPGGARPGPIPFASESGGILDDLDQLTQEIRLAFDDGGAFRWQVGAFSFYEDVAIVSLGYDTLNGSVQNGRADRSQETEAWAVFAAADIDLTDRLTASAGVRYTDDSRDFTGSRSQSPFGAPPLSPQTVSVSDAQVSWDAALRYEFTDALSGYTRVTKGFRAPTVQGRLVFGNNIWVADSETVTSGEVGLRYDTPALSASGAAFYYVIENQQLSAIGGQTNAVRLLNADEGVGYGLEGEVFARPTANLTLSGTLSWTETEIRDPSLSVPICGSPCTVLDPDGPTAGTVLIDGNPFPYAPEWVGSFSAEYRMPLASGEWFARTDWAFTGERNFLLYESAEFTGEAFWEGGLRLGYRDASGWDAAVFARNILDEDTALGAIDFNNLAGYVNQPRIVGVSFGIQLQ